MLQAEVLLDRRLLWLQLTAVVQVVRRLPVQVEKAVVRPPVEIVDGEYDKSSQVSHLDDPGVEAVSNELEHLLLVATS